jgi:hypothetical protein
VSIRWCPDILAGSPVEPPSPSIRCRWPRVRAQSVRADSHGQGERSAAPVPAGMVRQPRSTSMVRRSSTSSSAPPTISALGQTAWFEFGSACLLFAGVIPRADCIPCCAPSSASKVSRRQGRSTSSEGTDDVDPKVLGRTCDQQCVSYSDVGAMRAACAACLRTATAYWPRLRSGSVLGTTTVRWNASQFSAESSSMVFTVKFCRNLSM